jgi:hypothetical protein
MATNTRDNIFRSSNTKDLSMFKANTFVSAAVSKPLRGALACLLAIILLNPTASAAPSVSNQLDKLPSGATVQVRMNDGQILRGKLISRSGSTFDLVEPGSSDAETIETTNVATVKKADEHHQSQKVMKAILIGSFFALTGAAIAVSGK